MPEWICLIYFFAFGSCIGSFLNVVVYRLPRDISLVTPPSTCPACDTRIKFYHNIPLFSWLALKGKCKYCGSKIAPRYFVVELLTGIMFAAVFYLYFIAQTRNFNVGGEFGVTIFLNGGWLIYLAHITLFAALIAASAIDLQLWVIPLAVCWFVTAVGIVLSSIAGFVIDPDVVRTYGLFPRVSAATGALAAGALIGMIISLIALATGIIKRSYDDEPDLEEGELQTGEPPEEDNYNHRLESLKEIIFLLPMIVCGIAAMQVFKNVEPARLWWVDFMQLPVVAGLTGSLFGYFVGCAVVWATRILGTLGFGKEAMGLGDMHLMGAAGAIVGPLFVVIAFFIAPFFGLTWAAYQAFFKKTRQIPYGPFLSMGIFTVIIFHDWVRSYIQVLMR